MPANLIMKNGWRIKLMMNDYGCGKGGLDNSGFHYDDWQVDHVIVIHADMEAEAATAVEAQAEQYLVWY